MTNDPISDMLTRLRNAVAAGHSSVSMPHSRLKEQIAKLLADNNYIDGLAVDKSGLFPKLTLSLSADNDTISSLIRVSKPGRRVYAAVSEIPVVLSGRGMVIISTSSGLMTGRDAKQKGLGGELICKVW